MPTRFPTLTNARIMCAPVYVLPDLRPGFLGIKQLVNGLPLLPTRNLEPCLFTNSEERSRSNPINFSYARTGLKLTTFRHAWEGACTEAKISGLRFHDLRHTFATRLRGKGVHEIGHHDTVGSHHFADDFSVHSCDARESPHSSRFSEQASFAVSSETS